MLCVVSGRGAGGAPTEQTIRTGQIHASATTTGASAPSRVDWVDTAKGISIVLVVAMHATLGVEAAAGAKGWMGDVVAFAAPFRMAAFFLLAGLFLSRSIDAPWRETLDRKVLHFVYFYVLWLTIQFAFKAPEMIARYGVAGTLEAYLLAYVQPFGTLWFIYLLPLFYVATKLLRRLPIGLVLLGALALALPQIDTKLIVVDAFAGKFFFFLLGYAAHARIFALADAARTAPSVTMLFLGLWAGANAALVALGLAGLPGMALVLGLAGAIAVVAFAALVGASGPAAVLHLCGRHSIVIYLAFFLPMALSRAALLKTGLVADVGTVAAMVTIFAVAVPLLLHRLVTLTGVGRFLFDRPAWARLPAARKPEPRVVPAE